MTEEIVEMYETIAQPIISIRAILKAQKKKKFQKTIFYLPEQKNECFSKQLHIFIITQKYRKRKKECK